MGQFDVDTGAFAKEGQDRAAAQSQALMGIIAQHGQAGAQAYAQGQQAIQQQGVSALQQGASNARGSAVDGNQDFANQESGRMTAISNLYNQDLNAGNAAFGQDMARQESSNRDYLGQLSASLPIVAQNVQGQAQALGARAAAEEARREQERQMAELQMQAQREQMEGDRQARADARAAAAQGKDDPLLGAKLQAANDAHLDSEAGRNTPDPRADAAAKAERVDRARLDAIRQLGGPGTRGVQALTAMLAGQDASGIKTPRGHDLDMGLIRRLAESIMAAGV